MSYSQPPSNPQNSNNGPPPTTTSHSQIISSDQLTGYEDDPSLTQFYNFNTNNQSSYTNTSDNQQNPTEENVYQERYSQLPGPPSYLDYINTDAGENEQIELTNEEDYNADLDLIQNYIDAENNNQSNHPDDLNEDDAFTEEVQRAFANYENEFSSHWQSKRPTWEPFPEDEDETLRQMEECEFYMNQEYSTAEMPLDLIHRSQISVLNPDAVEFRPTWLAPSATIEDKGIHVISCTPCAAEKPKE